jgi:hypothetical protein
MTVWISERMGAWLFLLVEDSSRSIAAEIKQGAF